MITLVIVALALATAAYLLYQWALPKPIPGIPYDEHARRRILGNLPDLVHLVNTTGRARPFFSNHVLKHNSALTQVWLTPFGKPSLILADFRESQDILLRRFREFDKLDKSTTAFMTVVPNHHISMSSTDPKFKGNRDLIRDLMTPNFLHEVSAPEIYAKTLLLIDLWTVKAKLGGGRPFNARKDIFDAAMDIINAAAFGLGDDQSTVKHQLNHILSLSSSDRQVFTTNADGSISFPQLPQLPSIAAVEGVTKFLGGQFKASFPVLAHKIAMWTDRSLVRDFKLKDAFIHDEIEKAVVRLRKGESGLRSAMDFVLQREMNQAEKEGREPVFHSPRIHDELFGYVIGGHDTTSTSLAWMVKNLADYPDVQAKLRAALRAAYPEAYAEGRQPTVVELWKVPVPYLDAVLEESFRVDAPISLGLREAMVDTQLLGYPVPRGTAVFMVSDGPGFKTPPIPLPESARSNLSQSQSQEKSHNTYGAWDPTDMHLYRPERWLKTDPVTGAEVFEPKSGPLLAFSLGPRMCFGRRLAYLEARIVLALLVWNFEFNQLSPELSTRDVEDSLTVYPRKCYASVTKI